MLKFLSKVFPNKSEKDLKKIAPLVGQINEIFEGLATLSDDDLRAKTAEYREQINVAVAEHTERISALKKELRERDDLESNDRESLWTEVEEEQAEVDHVTSEILDKILPEAFALVKEACRRHVGTSWDVTGRNIEWDMVPFDVQLLGGIVLHHGKIAEMATGEGKTLVATMPMYLNALPGRGVHLVTVNDYLALRDSEWMGKIFEFLGLTVGCIQSSMEPLQRRKQYGCDITYGTNNEFGFDYLRDNMVISPEDLVHREYYYAIVDEVDSVLIDEARTPLIISGPVASEDQKFGEMKPRVDRLVNAQRNYVTTIVAEAEKLLAADDQAAAGVQLLRAYRGLPKHKRLTKLLSDPATNG